MFQDIPGGALTTQPATNLWHKVAQLYSSGEQSGGPPARLTGDILDNAETTTKDLPPRPLIVPLRGSNAHQP